MRDQDGKFAGFALYDPVTGRLLLGTDTELTQLDAADAQFVTLVTTGRTFVESVGDLTGVRAGDVRSVPGYPNPDEYVIPGETEGAAISISGGQAVETFELSGTATATIDTREISDGASGPLTADMLQLVGCPSGSGSTYGSFLWNADLVEHIDLESAVGVSPMEFNVSLPDGWLTRCTMAAWNPQFTKVAVERDGHIGIFDTANGLVKDLTRVRQGGTPLDPILDERSAIWVDDSTIIFSSAESGGDDRQWCTINVADVETAQPDCGHITDSQVPLHIDALRQWRPWNVSPSLDKVASDYKPAGSNNAQPYKVYSLASPGEWSYLTDDGYVSHAEITFLGWFASDHLLLRVDGDIHIASLSGDRIVLGNNLTVDAQREVVDVVGWTFHGSELNQVVLMFEQSSDAYALTLNGPHDLIVASVPGVVSFPWSSAAWIRDVEAQVADPTSQADALDRFAGRWASGDIELELRVTDDGLAGELILGPECGYEVSAHEAEGTGTTVHLAVDDTFNPLDPVVSCEGFFPPGESGCCSDRYHTGDVISLQISASGETLDLHYAPWNVASQGNDWSTRLRLV